MTSRSRSYFWYRKRVKTFTQAKDLHRITAAQAFGIPESEVTVEMRRVGKNINFHTLYTQPIEATVYPFYRKVKID